jgi:sec-independent protein translocase protein TatA
MLTGILEPTHLILILIVALVFLGPKRLPDAGRALGQGLSEFKRSLSGEHGDNPPISAPPAVPSEDDSGSAATPR